PEEGLDRSWRAFEPVAERRAAGRADAATEERLSRVPERRLPGRGVRRIYRRGQADGAERPDRADSLTPGPPERLLAVVRRAGEGEEEVRERAQGVCQQ